MGLLASGKGFMSTELWRCVHGVHAKVLGGMWQSCDDSCSMAFAIHWTRLQAFRRAQVRKSGVERLGTAVPVENL